MKSPDAIDQPMISPPKLSRRQFHASVTTAVASACGRTATAQAESDQSQFRLNYLLASSLYGCQSLGEILPEVSLTGANAVDLWPLPHGNQREQVDELGRDVFVDRLSRHNLSLGAITQYKLGAFQLQDEMRFAQSLGCRTIVTSCRSAKAKLGLRGKELKTAIEEFIQRMRPHIEVAEKTGVTIAIENHANDLIESPDSLKWLAELSPSPNLGIALAPYHLPQDPSMLGRLVATLGHSIVVFYAWQHGEGCMTALPKDQELKQLPGRGTLDFKPMLAALKQMQYRGWTEVFMHPFPRGIPILNTTSAVTAEINRARDHLESELALV